jgi:hypothetical protein
VSEVSFLSRDNDLTLVSNFSMNKMSPLHAWKKLIEAEVDDVAVSKYVGNSSEIRRISDAIKIYVDQTTALFNKLFNEAVVDCSNESLLLKMSEAELSNQMETAEAKTKLFSQVWNAMTTAKKMSVSVSASRAGRGCVSCSHKTRGSHRFRAGDRHRAGCGDEAGDKT